MSYGAKKERGSTYYYKDKPSSVKARDDRRIFLDGVEVPSHFKELRAILKPGRHDISSSELLEEVEVLDIDLFNKLGGMPNG